MLTTYNALTIAGTDPTGGAGIQADLKAFAALGVYGTSVMTSLVAQNTQGVKAIYQIDAQFVGAQLDAVLTDVRIDSAKIGMLATLQNVEIVADKLMEYQIKNVVLDTVMVSSSGTQLLAQEATECLIYRLLPIVSLITPNLPEAATLLSLPIAETEIDMQRQGEALLKLGAQAVLLKGGHLNSAESPDWLFTEQGSKRFTSQRVNTRNSHGTGCTLSAAIAALKLRYGDWNNTIIAAKNYLQGTLQAADKLSVGKGNGPLHHFYQWW